MMQSHPEIQSNLNSSMSGYKHLQQTANSGFTGQGESWLWALWISKSWWGCWKREALLFGISIDCQR